MLSTPLAKFAPEITVVVPDIPDDMVESYIRHAAIEFCERSRCLTREYVFDSQQDVGEYLLDDCDERIYVLESIRLTEQCDAEPLILGYDSKRGSCYSSCNRRTGRFEPPSLLVISPAPATSVVGGIIIRASVAPTQTACVVDDELYNRHYMAIVSGALSKLLLVPGKGASPTLAKIHLDLFQAAITRQFINAQMGYGRGHIKMQLERFV